MTRYFHTYNFLPFALVLLALGKLDVALALLMLLTLWGTWRHNR